VNANPQQPSDYRFLIGLLAGAAVGAGLAVWLTPTVNRAIRQGQDVRDDVADAVARGAREVERYATAAKSDRPAEPRTAIAG
jgi:gas vesicle protein